VRFLQVHLADELLVSLLTFEIHRECMNVELVDHRNFKTKPVWHLKMPN